MYASNHFGGYIRAVTIDTHVHYFPDMFDCAIFITSVLIVIQRFWVNSMADRMWGRFVANDVGTPDLVEMYPTMVWSFLPRWYAWLHKGTFGYQPPGPRIQSVNLNNTGLSWYTTKGGNSRL